MEKLMKKIEHLDDDEKDKLKKLLKEQKSDGDKVDWIYKDDEPDSEEYLLGRKIDHHVDTTRHDDLKDVPGALFTVSDEVICKRAEMDMLVKMREDPLYAIKQKEEDAKRRLLENPIKMKQLQQLVKEREAQMKQKHKKKKSKKKKKKRSRRSSDSSDSSDDDLINKYLAIVRQKEATTGSSQDQSQPRKDSHEERQKDRSRPSGDREKHRSRHHSSGSEDDGPSRASGNKHKQPYGLLVRDQQSQSLMRKESEKKSSRDTLKRSRSRDREDSSRSRDRSKRSRSRDRAKRSRERGKRSRSRERTSKRSKSPVYKKPEPRKKLSREEMERKRVAMQDNASQRDRQREDNVRRYREETKREEEMAEKTRDKPAEFVRPLMKEHAAQSTVADRIKRNIYNIQRTNADLDKNFTKH